MKATLSIDMIPGYPRGLKILTIDCVHGVTTVLTAAGAAIVSDDVAARLALARHRTEHPRCRCIRHLERRYTGTVRPNRGRCA